MEPRALVATTVLAGHALDYPVNDQATPILDAPAKRPPHMQTEESHFPQLAEGTLLPSCNWPRAQSASQVPRQSPCRVHRKALHPALRFVGGVEFVSMLISVHTEHSDTTHV